MLRHCAVGKGAMNGYLGVRGLLCRSSQATAPAMPVISSLFGELQQLVPLHGYWVVGLIVGLESLVLPLSGKTILVHDVIYASSHTCVNICWLIAVATIWASM